MFTVLFTYNINDGENINDVNALRHFMLLRDPLITI